MAHRIATLANRNFLIAGLVARTHGLYDDHAVSPEKLVFTASVESALGGFLDRLPAVDGITARTLLTALAFAEAPGLDLDLWRVAVRALSGSDMALADLAQFASGSAANFLVETAGQAQATVYRLFHQALSDVLVNHRRRPTPMVVDEQSLTRALVGYGSRVGWWQAPAYLFRSLPGHAVRAGLVDTLLNDIDYILHADLRRLIPAADYAETPIGRERAHLLRLTPRAITVEPSERLVLLSVTEALGGTGTGFREHNRTAPYRALWARAARRAERTVLEGHTGEVNAVCAVRWLGGSCWPRPATIARCDCGTRAVDGLAPYWRFITPRPR